MYQAKTRVQTMPMATTASDSRAIRSGSGGPAARRATGAGRSRRSSSGGNDRPAGLGLHDRCERRCQRLSRHDLCGWRGSGRCERRCPRLGKAASRGCTACRHRRALAPEECSSGFRRFFCSVGGLAASARLVVPVTVVRQWLVQRITMVGIPPWYPRDQGERGTVAPTGERTQRVFAARTAGLLPTTEPGKPAGA